jgi:hypothetical protein
MSTFSQSQNESTKVCTLMRPAAKTRCLCSVNRALGRKYFKYPSHGTLIRPAFLAIIAYNKKNKERRIKKKNQKEIEYVGSEKM